MTCLYEASGDGFEQSAFRFWTKSRAIFAFCILFWTNCLSCIDQSWSFVTPPKLSQPKGKFVQHSLIIILKQLLSLLTGHKAATARWKDIPDKGPSKQNNTERWGRKRKEKNVWDFKLRKIKMQAVSFIEFAVTLCLRTQIPLMAATPCVKSLFNSTTTSSIKLHKFLCFPQTHQ